MLKLSREEFILVCGPADGIRLNNAIQLRYLHALNSHFCNFNCNSKNNDLDRNNEITASNNRSNSDAKLRAHLISDVVSEFKHCHGRILF